MKRRFNYTGREKLNRESIKISINKMGGKPISINTKLNLDEVKYPTNTKIYLDAYHKTDRKRFDFGEIQQIKIPDDLTISELSYANNLMFRLMLIDESGEHGKIVAHVDRIRTDEDLNQKPILPVQFEDIEQQVWKLDFSGVEGGPILILNNKIPNIENISKTDPMFFMYIYPAIIKEILTNMIFVDGVENVEDPPVEWHKDWLNFSKMILPHEPIPTLLDPRQNEFDREDSVRWIDEVVNEFCNSRSNEWNALKQKIVGD